MLSGVLITLFTTGIKLSWESQPLYDISLFHLGAEVALITSGDFTRKFCSSCCVCMYAQIKRWRFERALLYKKKKKSTGYSLSKQCKQDENIYFFFNTLANRGGKKPIAL